MAKDWGRITAWPGISGTLLRGLQLLVLATALTGSLVAEADTHRVAIMVDGNGSDYQVIARRYRSVLDNELGDGRLEVEVLGRGRKLKNAGNYDLLMSLGSQAAKNALAQRGDTPLLCTLISRDAFLAAIKQQYSDPTQALEKGISVLYLDQPIARVFELTRLVVPDASSVGTIVGPALLSRQHTLATQAEEAELSLHTINLDIDDNPVAAIDTLVQNVDVVVALPDKIDITRQIARWLLYLSYRRHKPLVGYSRRYTEAGAVASLYSSAQDVAEEAAKLSVQLLGQTAPGAIHWPGQYSVSINHKVARSLKLKLRRNDYYEQALAHWEKER